MKKYIKTYALALLALLISCESEMDLEKSIFIPDEEHPHLPKYSEWGYNTFGAYYDREVFRSNDYTVPLKVIVTNDTTSFVFKGHKGSGSSGTDMKITFGIKNLAPSDYTEIVTLNGKNYDLKSSDTFVKLKIGNQTFTPPLLSGNFNIKKAQNIFLDNKQTEVVISGVFKFQILYDNEPITISYGRFDTGVSYNNFFILR